MVYKPHVYVDQINPDIVYDAMKFEWDNIPNRYFWHLNDQINFLWLVRHDPGNRCYLRTLITRAKELRHE